MHTIKQIISCTLISLATVMIAKAQVASLPLLQLEQDLGAVAMGAVIAPMSHTASMYSLPSMALYNEQGQRLSVHTSLGLYPSGKANSAYFGSAALGYRTGKHLFMIGGRYLGLPTIPYTDILGQERGNIHPRDFSIDLGYALQISEHLSGYARATYLQSYNSLTADVLALSIGASYLRKTHSGKYLIMAALDHIGPTYKYGPEGASQKLPQRATLGLSYSFLPREQLTLGLRATRYLVSESASQTVIGFGLQWEVLSQLYLRSGYTYQKDNSLIHLGAGYKLNRWALDLAYELNKDNKFNCLRVGINYSF